MLQRAEIYLIGNHRDVEQRSRQQYTRKNASLMQVQAARACEEDRLARLNIHRAIPFLVEIIEPAGERFQNVVDAGGEMLPGVGVGILQVQHHSGSSISHACVVVADGGRKSGSLPACACCSAASRRTISERWRNVSAACSGARNSRKPAGRSRAASKPAGAVFTGISRSESALGVMES